MNEIDLKKNEVGYFFNLEKKEKVFIERNIDPFEAFILLISIIHIRENGTKSLLFLAHFIGLALIFFSWQFYPLISQCLAHF